MRSLKIARFTLLAFGCAAAMAVACSSSSSNTPASDVDAATPVEGGTTADTSSPTDAGTTDSAPAPENDCVTFVDRTADSASRNIQWDLSVVTAPERCMKIKAGQTVSWVNGTGVANFTDHPLVVYKPGGGMAPTVDMTTGKGTFPTAALFGFACGIHPQMRGVVLVE